MIDASTVFWYNYRSENAKTPTTALTVSGRDDK